MNHIQSSSISRWNKLSFRHQHLSYKETLDTLVPHAKQTVFSKDEDTVEEIEDDSDGSSCDSEDDVLVKRKIDQEVYKKSNKRAQVGTIPFTKAEKFANRKHFGNNAGKALTSSQYESIMSPALYQLYFLEYFPCTLVYLV